MKYVYAVFLQGFFSRLCLGSLVAKAFWSLINTMSVKFAPSTPLGVFLFEMVKQKSVEWVFLKPVVESKDQCFCHIEISQLICTFNPPQINGVLPIWDALRVLVPFVQFTKRERHPWWSVTKWYQFVRSTTYDGTMNPFLTNFPK